MRITATATRDQGSSYTRGMADRDDFAVAAVERDLESRGIAARTVWFDASTATAGEAAAQLRVDVGAIANSLMFTCDGQPLLILASGAHRVDVRIIGRLLGGKVRTAAPDYAHDVSGQQVGGIAPIGHPAPIRTLVDVALAAFDEVWVSAGHSHAVFASTFDQLVEITNGTPVRVVREAAETDLA
jgi:prolyl-tRNA editing enzyme YbaK/EbsC (Cys-tRNA(Pro) deacylase)